MKMNKTIQNDMMRYKKNKLPGNLVLLAIVFNCLYFMVMYGQNVDNNIKAKFADGSTVYNIQTGLSVILNLVVLLVTFLTSEEVKGYNKKFCIVTFVLAAVQIVRIFIYPITTYNSQLANGYYVFDIDVLLELIIFLVASAGCLIAGGVIGLLNCIRLEKFRNDLESGTVDLETALKQEPETGVETTAEPVEAVIAEKEV